LRLFLEHGYEGVSMDAIAKVAGTTKASLYARFDSKEELFDTVLWWALQRSDWPVAEMLPPDLDDLRAALISIANASIKRALHPDMIKLSRIASAYALLFPRIAQKMHAVGYSNRYQLLVELLKRHAAKGAIIAADVSALAEHFLAMVSGGPARLASFGIVRDPAEQQRRIQTAVDLFLRGIQS
jgi:AcrR family transcriptional regulator